MPGHYQYHLFFCTNLRERGTRPCCQQAGASRLRDWTKARVEALGLNGPGKVRVNTAGCMDRCEEGPVLVIYPDGVWYSYADESDLEAIIQEHLINHRVVDRLRL
jgi:(2Fe-2S) ferredoxin